MVGFPPKSSILTGVFHDFHHPFWGYHYFWKHSYIDMIDPIHTPWKFNIFAPEKWMVFEDDPASYWVGRSLFRGELLNFGRVPT